MKTEQKPKPIEFSQFAIGHFPIPLGYSKYALEVDNCCGELAIAGVVNIRVPQVFEKGKILKAELSKGTLQKRMREILSNLGYETTQRSVKDKFKIPKCDLAIVRVSFGDPEQFWIETARRSHYVALKRSGANHYVLDNRVLVDGKHAWIERIEFRKVIKADKMFVTSYLEIKPKDVKS